MHDCRWSPELALRFGCRLHRRFAVPSCPATTNGFIFLSRAFSGTDGAVPSVPMRGAAHFSLFF